MTTATLLVEGGGSTTRAGVCVDGELDAICEGASCNLESVGLPRAQANLRATIEAIFALRPGMEFSAAWFCLSSVPTDEALDSVARELLSGLTDLYARADLWVSNDVAPLLVHDGQIANRAVVVCGTGTGFCAINLTEGLSARASGLDYLLTDEGGGFDIGLRGLRAIMRARDGRGQQTALSARLSAWRGVGVDGLYELIYRSREAKVLIASFAPFVLEAAANNDLAAQEIASGAVEELLSGTLAVSGRAQLAGPFEIVLAGSNLTIAPFLQDGLRRALDQALPAAHVMTIHDSPLMAVGKMAAILPREPRYMDLLRRTLPLAHITLNSKRKAAIS